MRGIKRRSSPVDANRFVHLHQDLHVDHQYFKRPYGGLNDTSNLIRIVPQVEPAEIRTLGVVSNAQVSFKKLGLVFDAISLSTLSLLNTAL